MPIVQEINSSDTLVVATAGFRNELGLPVADFFKESGLSSASKIIITDPTRQVSLAGSSPDFPTFFSLLDYLKREVERLSPARLIITGTSMGGHTALLLGHLLKADHVVAFAPYPYLSPEAIKASGDLSLEYAYQKRGGAEQIDRLPSNVKQFLDLRNVLSTWNGKTSYVVHVSRYNKWDYRRSMYLNHLPMVSVIAHPLATHGIPYWLSQDEKLKQCFEFPYTRTLTLFDIYLHFRFSMLRIAKSIRIPLTHMAWRLS